MPAPDAPPTEQIFTEPFYWDQYRDTTVGRYLFRREHAFIRRAFNGRARAGTILDVGCGSGRLTLPLQGMGFRMVGLDINRIGLGVLRRQSRDVPAILGDSTRLPFAAGSFDGVIAIQSLDYVEHHAFLRECGRVLRPGGLLIFDAINRHSYKWHLKKRVGRALTLPSANLDYRELLQAMADQGFEARAISGYNWPPFTRDSDSRLVDVAAAVESVLRLHRFYRISPKILVAARKERP